MKNYLGKRKETTVQIEFIRNKNLSLHKNRIFKHPIYLAIKKYFKKSRKSRGTNKGGNDTYR